MMAHSALCFRVRFGGQNIEAAINLKGVGIDNLGIEFFSPVRLPASFFRRPWDQRRRKYPSRNNCMGVSVRDAIDRSRAAADTAALQSRP